MEGSAAQVNALKFLREPPLPTGVKLGYHLMFRAAVPTIQPSVRALIGLQPARGSEQVGRATVRALRWALGSSPSWHLALVRSGASVPGGLFRQPLPAHGGEILSDLLWDQVAGMDAEKRIIDGRVVAPLSDPETARRLGVRAPATVMLFGPPGTGKTTFAKAIAGRLGWPFIELLPSKLESGDDSLSAELRVAMTDLLQLDRAVVFIDEFDEIASARERNPATKGVVNELLKMIPSFRSAPEHLLVCATNFVAGIDAAVLRPGRFDLVIPIGPPDLSARTALWEAALAPLDQRSVDVEALARMTDGYTPGDVELATQRAAAAAFDRVREGSEPSDITAHDLTAASSAPRRRSPPTSGNDSVVKSIVSLACDRPVMVRHCRRASVRTGQAIGPSRGTRRWKITSNPALASSWRIRWGGSARMVLPPAPVARLSSRSPATVTVAIDAISSRPPGFSTRASSVSAPAWSRYQWNDSVHTTRSTDDAANGSCRASARTRGRSSPPSCRSRPAASVSIPSERSTPTMLASGNLRVSRRVS